MNDLTIRPMKILHKITRTSAVISRRRERSVTTHPERLNRAREATTSAERKKKGGTIRGPAKSATPSETTTRVNIVNSGGIGARGVITNRKTMTVGIQRLGITTGDTADTEVAGTSAQTTVKDDLAGPGSLKNRHRGSKVSLTVSPSAQITRRSVR